MKRILITGQNSYVGKSFKEWIENRPQEYKVNSISVRDNSWKDIDFSSYDAVLHAAGIAHRKENAELYYRINRDLAFEVAKKAKVDGVKQFIFLSSMSVYGLESGVITRSTPLNPKSHYGKSKLEAERLIAKLENEDFRVAILRPPMVYGKGCKGNYVKLSRLTLITPIFPKVDNERSMIFVDNLSELFRLLIDSSQRGIFHPQNEEYVCTSKMVELVARYHGKKIRLTKIFNPLIKFAQTNTLNKIFGDLVYEKCISELKMKYQVNNFESSILLTERKR